MFPLLSYQHATEFERAYAPSNVAFNAEAQMLMLVFASQGTIVSMPDYLGQGRSKIQHPYLHADSEASASLDMLRAAVQLCDKLGVQHDRLFLSGFSQGGHATMALQRLIESRYPDEFPITASGPVAGPYDLPRCWNAWCTRSPSLIPAAMARYALGYASRNHRPLSSMFLPKMDALASRLLDGSHGMSEVMKGLPSRPQALFVPELLKAVAAHTGLFYKDLVANSVYDWTPKAPTRFFHARGDEIVPFAVAESAAAAMGSRGATVWVVDLGRTGHVGAFLPGMVAVKKWFATVE